jgi:hypothetical protein
MDSDDGNQPHPRFDGGLDTSMERIEEPGFCNIYLLILDSHPQVTGDVLIPPQ